ncbi:galactosyltransferase-domain-containing protein [Pilobolus umbonatus]|nr:galactosyltransferase-domain-containing protein [Pilobolus umbonatus]
MKTKKAKPPRFYFWRKTLSLSDLNIPRRSKRAIDALRTLSLIPSFLGFLYNNRQALYVPVRDAGGAIIIQSSQVDYIVASFWCALAGYWNWILTTSMMRRWIFHYEISNAIVRLITFIIITWCISAYVSSKNGPDQPIRTWMINCSMLLVTAIIRLTIVSDPKYHRKPVIVTEPNLFLKLTIKKVLIYPMSVATCLSVFAVLFQIDRLQYTASQLMVGPVSLNAILPTPTAGTSILILILSSWSHNSFERRDMMRKTGLKLLHDDNLNISVDYRFVIGNPPSAQAQLFTKPTLIREVAQYQDIIMVQSSDLEKDKSRKVYEALKWARSIDQHDYIVKTDDDIFVRWDVILKETSQLDSPSYYWKGLTYRNIPVHILSNAKSINIDYGLPVLPAYTHGMLYLFSRDILHLIVAPNSPRRFITSDGENVAIWLFGFNIHPIHDKRIQDADDVCENDMIGKRMKTTMDMSRIYLNLVSGRPQCNGFKSTACAMCYSCSGKKFGWRSLNLACDEKKGVTLSEMAGFPQIAGIRPW